MWSAVGGCWLSGQPRVVASSRHDSGEPSGGTWGGSQFVSGRSTELYYRYLVML